MSRTIREELENFAKEHDIVIKKPNPKVYKLIYDKTKSRERALIVANRYDNEYHIVKYQTTSLNRILSRGFIGKLPDVDKAVDVMKEHMDKGSRIVQVTDYDLDGIAAGAVGYRIMKDIFGYKKFKVIVNQRSWKNGMNDTIINQILEMHRQRPIGLVITSDHGSSDGERLMRLKEAGIDVIVTDHHIPSETDPPDNVDAWVNHKRPESMFLNDITGTAVLFMTYYYYYLKHLTLKDEIRDKFFKLLTYVGLTTISDSVDLKDYVNKKFVKFMLNMVNSEKPIDAFWNVVKERITSGWFVDQEFLSFNLIPRLNSPGRIGDPSLAFRLLIAKKQKEAEELLDEISNINDNRKILQNNAMDNLEVDLNNTLVSVAYKEGISGVQGILASKLMLKNNTPVNFCFTKNEEGILTGSGRGKPGVNLIDILNGIRNKKYIVNFGGHKGACGIDIKEGYIEEFYKDVCKWLEENKSKLTEVKIEIDDIISNTKDLVKTFWANIAELPYGQNYERPVYLSKFKLLSSRIFTKHGNNFMVADIRLMTDNDKGEVYKLLYSVTPEELPIFNNLTYGDKLYVVYNIGLNKKEGNMNTISITANKVFVEDKEL